MFKKFLALVTLALCGPLAQATPIDAATSGLVSPATLITFNEVVLPPNSPVTDEYAGYGVIFSPTLYYMSDDSTNPYPPGCDPTISCTVDGYSVSNFHTVDPSVVDPPSPLSFSLDFLAPQTRVSFAMVSNYSPWTFEAFYQGSVVESFTEASVDDTGAFYGFTGITFDSIHITTDGDYATIDNIAFGSTSDTGTGTGTDPGTGTGTGSPPIGPAEVPEPSSTALLGIALLALGVTCRRRLG